MSDSKHAGLSPALVESVAGLSAGSVATLVVHPLDIVKTRMQIHRSAANPSVSLTTMSLIRSLTQNPHPIASLYRGLTPNLIGNASSWSAFFFFKNRVERAIAYWKAGPLPTSRGSGADARSSTKDVLSSQDFFISSALAGALTQVLTNPVWVLKTRMLSSDRTAAGAYTNMWSGARQLYRSEGLRGFYRGLGVSLIGVSHGAVQFAVYEPAKQVYFAGRRQKGDNEGRLSNEATVVISSVSKLVAGAVTYPYQVLRSRLQNYDADERFGRGIRGVVRRIWQEEGFRGFYRGLMPGVVRVMPATWVTFLVYENVKFYLPHWAE
ncbi:mitochondrial folate carrier protein [Colletotrichum truncatum]|uniref:Mitochondrial folate carrier protein n=1 Tax=Colletotrichum truncatum TaxID=5467 RepID=A0ACC3ZIJ1_COLTU|nr:mitochondrial folate carrier protein [Colletotrichum truncatum]KAF6785715.1 mitochondrial folate carrier protein [Colletotrichum truncatum]